MDRRSSRTIFAPLAKVMLAVSRKFSLAFGHAMRSPNESKNVDSSARRLASAWENCAYGYMGEKVLSSLVLGSTIARRTFLLQT